MYKRLLPNKTEFLLPIAFATLVLFCLQGCTLFAKRDTAFDPQGSLSSESMIPVDTFPDIALEILGPDPVEPQVVVEDPSPQSVDRLAEMVQKDLLEKDLKEVAAPPVQLMKIDTLDKSDITLSKANETPLIFDFPVTYNDRVKAWIKYFQTTGRTTFKTWLERSARFLPLLEEELGHAGLPRDLAYVAMIESGFNASASSHAGAIGMWQFIEPTATRYKLQVDWWIDERRDYRKATQAAIRYMLDLNRQFDSWYLVAASYNMGENGVRRLIKKYNSHNFWELAEMKALPQETSDYVPKIIAATLISKAPALYGFRELNYQMPFTFESVLVPGGTDIVSLASYLGVSDKYLKELNPELLKGFVPANIRSHKIRVPKGSVMAVSQFVQSQVHSDFMRSLRAKN